jgi:hypothetical protein
MVFKANAHRRADQPVDGLGDEDLTAGGRRSQARREVHGATDVLSIKRKRLTRMYPNADLERILSAPRSRLLNGHGTPNRRGTGPKNHVETVTFGLDLRPPLSGHLPPNETSISLQQVARRRITRAFHEGRVAAEVGKQKRARNRSLR